MGGSSGTWGQRPLLRLLGLLGHSRRRLAITTGLGLLQSLALVPIAFLLRHMFNVAIPAHDDGQIVLLGIAMCALSVIGAVIGIAAQRAGSVMARSVVAGLRGELVRRLYDQSSEWHDRQDPGGLQLTVVQHTERLSDVLVGLTSAALPSTILAVVLGVATAIVNPLLTACVIATVPLFALVSIRFGGSARRHYREWLAGHNRLGGETRIALRTMELARVHGAQAWEIERRDAAIENARVSARRFDTARAQNTGAQMAVSGIGGVVPLIVGGLAVSSGSMTFGDLIAFYSLGLMVLRSIANAVAGIGDAAISSEALAEVELLLSEPPPPPHTGVVLEPFSGAVTFEDVEFAYGNGTPVLQGVSFAVLPGECVALMGPSGSGKTTVVNLLLGQYAARRGAVRIDGVRIEHVDIAALRRQIGVIMQDTIVFPGTVRQNITYGRDGVEELLIDQATAQAGLDEFIASLQHGYEHETGEEGGLVSGGQRQRIGIARALLGEPRLLVLDEPTLNLDVASIDRLLATLKDMDCTTLIVTHDTKVAAHADRIIYMRDGQITASPAESNMAVT